MYTNRKVSANYVYYSRSMSQTTPNTYIDLKIDNRNYYFSKDTQMAYRLENCK